MTTKKDNESDSKKNLEKALKYISKRCREESEEEFLCEFDLGNDPRDWYNEALIALFEKMADITEEAIKHLND